MKMPLTTELVDVTKGTDWKLIELGSNYCFDLQNILGVILEYAYNTPMEKGAQLFSGDRLLENTQNVYIRCLDPQQEGKVSVVWDSNA